MSTANDTPLRTWQTGHIGLNVSDLARSKRFYEQVFGFQVLHESQEPGRAFAFLGDDTRLILTLWQQSEGTFQKHTPGLHHLSFQVNTTEEIQEAEQRLRDIGANFLYEGIVPHSEGAPSGGIFFEDPDGIRLEIYSPTAGSGQSAPTADAPSCGFF
jgi:lactoylglutathione lyase